MVSAQMRKCGIVWLAMSLLSTLDVRCWCQDVTQTSTRVLIRPTYIGIVLHSDAVKVNKSFPKEGRWEPSDVEIAAAERQLRFFILKEKESGLSKNIAARTVKEFYRQYFGYSFKGRKMICIVMFSPKLVDDKFSGLPLSVGDKIRELCTGDWQVWDADVEWQRYYYDVSADAVDKK